MARTKRVLGGLVAALALLAAAVLTSGPAAADGGVKVMPLGDSITDGFNVPGGYRIDLWQKLVADGYTIDFVGSLANGPAGLGDRDHEGHSGWRIDQIDANIVSWLRTYTPHTILLHIGTNDMVQNPSGASDRLAALIDKIIATLPDVYLFVATIVPLPFADASVRSFNAAIPGIVQARAAAGKRVYLVDMYSALTAADLADGVHPNAVGYSKMADVWYQALRSVPGSLGGGSASPSPSPSVSPSPSPSSPIWSPSPSPSPSPPVSSGGCTATYRTISTWPGGFQAEVTVRNDGTTPLNGWTVRMTLAPGQSINSLWNGVNSGSSGAISVRNAPYNGTIGPNDSTAFGFVAGGDGSVTPSGLTCTSP